MRNLTHPPAPLQWLIRRLHNGLNRTTQRTIAQSDGRFGWSAWSHYYAQQGYPPAVYFEKLIDWLFWPGHCEEDYLRITTGQQLDTTDWRTVWGAMRALGLALSGPIAIVLLLMWLL